MFIRHFKFDSFAICGSVVDFHELSPPAFKFLKTARAVTIRETEKDDSGTPFQVFRTAVLRSRGFLFTLAHHHQVVGVLVFSILVVPSGFLLISVVQFLILISTVPVASSTKHTSRPSMLRISHITLTSFKLSIFFSADCQVPLTLPQIYI